ncbi:uncharacterized protein LOC116654380 [Coturnix japonica]|uniref:uncharacterized protein LOC116654380 n=1 Tax=Coturnix japonica TaxID=93934 RepID=UPI0013A5F2BE|nr:uncharacterized protein LOC116654380 [Coturnix japonica]
MDCKHWKGTSHPFHPIHFIPSVSSHLFHPIHFHTALQPLSALLCMLQKFQLSGMLCSTSCSFFAGNWPCWWQSTVLVGCSTPVSTACLISIQHMAQAAFTLLLPDSGTSCVSHRLAHLLSPISASPQHMADAVPTSSFLHVHNLLFISAKKQSHSLPPVLSWLSTFSPGPSACTMSCELVLSPLTSKKQKQKAVGPAPLFCFPITNKAFPLHQSLHLKPTGISVKHTMQKDVWPPVHETQSALSKHTAKQSVHTLARKKTQQLSAPPSTGSQCATSTASTSTACRKLHFFLYSNNARKPSHCLSNTASKC